jgi:hypothetical protein
LHLRCAWIHEAEIDLVGQQGSEKTFGAVHV